MTSGGNAVVVVGPSEGPAAPIAERLAERGQRVHRVERVAALADELAALSSAGTPAHAVVHLAISAPGATARLVDLDESGWFASAEGPILDALTVLQTAHRLAASPCRIVVVTDGRGSVGQSAHVAPCTAEEGIRALAKSAARAWGADGTTVNIVSRHAASTSPDSAVPQFTDPPLADDEEAALADMVALCCGPDASRLTGATLFADLGRTMLP